MAQKNSKHTGRKGLQVIGSSGPDASGFLEKGLNESEFDDLFEEKDVDFTGKSKSRLDSYVSQYSLVLHAVTEICHANDKAKHAPNYLSAGRAIEVVELFIKTVSDTQIDIY